MRPTAYLCYCLACELLTICEKCELYAKNVEHCLGKCYYNVVYKIVGEAAFHLYRGCYMKKNKIGFTLIEMMTVVAIIIILTTATTFSVSTYMGKARSVSSAAESHVNKYDEAKNSVNALNPTPPATPTPGATPTLGATPTPGATPSTYTITFDSAGGSAVSSITQPSGTAVTPSANPTRDGYTFAGWNPAVPATMPVDGAALTAQWTANSYTITFDSAGGSAVSSITQGYGTNVAAPANPTRTGYTFAGWSSEVPATMPVDGAALIAQWTGKVYNVTFSGNGGGTPSPTSKSVTLGSTYGPLATSTRTGYAFNGWYNGETPVTPETTVTTASNHVLYAHWTQTAFNVTFSGNGGDTPSPTSKSVTLGSTYGPLATVARTGYAFNGWCLSGGTPVTPETTVTTASNHVLYAQWTPVPTATPTPIPTPTPTPKPTPTPTPAPVKISISSMAIMFPPGYMQPKAGQIAPTSINATPQYSATISWSPALSSGNFVAGTIYTATITITPKTGYTLTGVSANFFNTLNATSTNAAGSGVVTAKYPTT